MFAQRQQNTEGSPVTPSASNVAGFATLMILFIAGLGIAIFDTVAVADDKETGNADGTVEASQVDDANGPDLQTLIKQLDADQFAKRRQASQKLHEAGVPAIDALKQAALGDSREAATRSLDILKKHFAGDDPAAKEAAKKALEEIAKSDKPIAGHAKLTLNPPKEAPLPPPAFRIAPGQIQIQVRAINGNRVARNVRIVNGRKEIEVDDNGRKIKIVDDPQGGIKVDVTEKQNGKEVTKQYAAKDLEELKKKHPDGYKIYQEYGKQGGIKIQAIQGVPGAPAVPNIQIQQNNILETTNKKVAAMQIQHAERMVKSATEALERLKGQSDDAKAIGESIERLQAIRKQLQDEKSRLED